MLLHTIVVICFHLLYNSEDFFYCTGLHEGEVVLLDVLFPLCTTFSGSTSEQVAF